MVDEERAAIRQMMEAHTTITLATCRDGEPWGASLFFASDSDLNLYFVSDYRTRHARDIGDGAEVVATVNADCADWSGVKGLQIAGYAETVNGMAVPVPPAALQMESGDVDGDGLPDAWEIHYSGDTNSLSADVDSDRDGHSNRDEWFAGTDPTNSASVLSITGVGYTGDDARVLHWQSAVDRYYSVLFASNLLESASVLTNGIPATAPANSIQIPAEWPTKGFFMIKVEE